MTGHRGDAWRVVNGDSREVLRAMSAASVDSSVCDPPYEIGMMGRKWDATGVAYDVGLWSEVLRVLKPGGHLLAFGGTRAYHRMTCAIEDAGFEVRDSIHWIYSTGFPKSPDVSKAMGKAGASADTSRRWLGWGTALKPAHEPIVVARKPFGGTVASNVLSHGTGAINIGGCRVKYASASDLETAKAKNPGRSDTVTSGVYGVGRPQQMVNDVGRWPPNLLFHHAPECGTKCSAGCSVAELDEQSGGASRFFPTFRYQPKATKRERGEDNAHPTVKPIGLMRWLVRLVTPPGGFVLDPFAGSGSTGVAAVAEGFRFVGIELLSEYADIARARVASQYALGRQSER
jgi:hypothetical protein